jgi:crotonobetainyl-CoA:carnitine CoA-transferase CaiB-like acyl-CoA transferase
MLKTSSVLLVAIASGLLGASGAAAATLRAQRTTAGVRATLSQYDTAILAGNSKAACALLTTKAQTQLAKANHAATCADVIEAASAALKTDPKDAAALRSYAGKVRITQRGNTASVPKLGVSGHTTLTYSRGLWYLS